MVAPIVAAAGQVPAFAAAEPVIRALDNLTNALTDGFKFSDKAQKASLALGTSLRGTRATISESMEGLRGSSEGQFAAGIMKLDAGLKGNEKGVAR